MDTKLLYREESFLIQGAIYEVYREMGSGFLEAVYQECLEKEFTKQHIPFLAQHGLRISYKGSCCDKPASRILFAMSPSLSNSKRFLQLLENTMLSY